MSEPTRTRTATGATQATPRPDSSMMLLTDIFEHPVDPAYAEVTARRVNEPAGPTRRSHWLSLVVLAMVGLLLAAAAAQVRQGSGAARSESSQLRDRVQAATQRNDQLSAQVQSEQRQLEASQTQALSLADQDTAEAQRIRDLSAVAGTRAVSGPGISVLVDDAPPDAAGDGPDAGRITDLDLQQLANGLWEAGAEAVSINGQRLTSLSAIRSANQVILVNYRPLSPPYSVLAIGDPKNLASRFADSRGGQWLDAVKSQYPITFTVKNSKKLTLRAQSEVQLRFVKLEETP